MFCKYKYMFNSFFKKILVDMWAMIKLIQLRLEYRKTLLHILHKHS